MNKTLSVLMPAFNEETHVRSVLTKLLACDDGQWQIVVCDDASTDGTIEKVKSVGDERIEIVTQRRNGGKTSAVLAGLQHATGSWVIIQDADLEYDPHDITKLLVIGQEYHGVVYGRRPSLWHRPSRWVLAGGVLVVDLCLLLVYRRWVRDHATCYKLMPTQMLRDFDLQSTGFEGCVEITAKLMRSGIPIRQIPISYSPRTTSEGKKLTWRYGFAALKSVWRWRNWKPSADTRLRVLSVAKSENESSSPVEEHPQALTEPDVNLSAHPALIIQTQDEFPATITQTDAVRVEQHGPSNSRWSSVRFRETCSSVSSLRENGCQQIFSVSFRYNWLHGNRFPTCESFSFCTM